MIATDIIEPIDYQDIKCCGATTLAQKAHEGSRLTLEELQHRLNDECVQPGHPTAFNLPPRPTPRAGDENHDSHTTPKTKWRVCQDFAKLNKVTKVLPMPQGDIRAKQHKLGNTDGSASSTLQTASTHVKSSLTISRNYLLLR
jgi:hypothetical protein